MSDLKLTASFDGIPIIIRDTTYSQPPSTRRIVLMEAGIHGILDKTFELRTCIRVILSSNAYHFWHSGVSPLEIYKEIALSECSQIELMEVNKQLEKWGGENDSSVKRLFNPAPDDSLAESNIGLLSLTSMREAFLAHIGFTHDALHRPEGHKCDPVLAMQDSENVEYQLEAIVAKGRKHLRNARALRSISRQPTGGE